MIVKEGTELLEQEKDNERDVDGTMGSRSWMPRNEKCCLPGAMTAVDVKHNQKPSHYAAVFFERYQRFQDTLQKITVLPGFLFAHRSLNGFAAAQGPGSDQTLM